MPVQQHFIFACVMADCQHIQEGDKELTEEQSVEIALNTYGRYEKVNKEKTGGEGRNIKEKGDACFAQAMQDTGKGARQVHKGADKTQGENKGTRHFAFIEKHSRIFSEQKKTDCA